MRRRGQRRPGFTLIEVLGVVFVTALIIGFASDYYIDLSRASSRASVNTREIRRGTAILDRIARDFEAALLVVAPPDLDPQFHPWLFIGESRYGDLGADHIKFVTRNHQPRLSQAREQDLALVAYTVVRSEQDESFALYRWSTPHLGDSLDTSFPNSDDEGSVLLADDIAAFGVTFYSEDGDAKQSWNSTTLVESNLLPDVVEIAVSLANPDDFETALEDFPVYSRRVRLPVRPLDLAVLIDPEGAAAEAEAEAEAEEDESEEDGDGEREGRGEGSGDRDEEDRADSESVLTADQCVDIGAWHAATNPGPHFERKYLSYATRPWADVASTFDLRMFDDFMIANPNCN